MIRLGEYTFDVPEPPALRSFALQQRVLPIAGRVAGVLLNMVGRSGDTDLSKLLDEDVAKVLPMAMPALSEVVAAMPPGELEALTQELLRDATVTGWGGTKKPVALFGGVSDTFDAVMRGRTMDTWHLLWHALQVWYPDFFARAAALKGGGQKENRSEESST